MRESDHSAAEGTLEAVCMCIHVYIRALVPQYTRSDDTLERRRGWIKRLDCSKGRGAAGGTGHAQRAIANCCIAAHDGQLQITNGDGQNKRRDDSPLGNSNSLRRKKLFTVVKHCDGLPMEAVESPSLEILKT